MIRVHQKRHGGFIIWITGIDRRCGSAGRTFEEDEELEAPEADSSADESPPETTAPDKELSELLALSGEEL